MSLSWHCHLGSVTKEVIVQVSAAEKPKEKAKCNIDVTVVEGELAGKYVSESILEGGNKDIIVGESDTEVDRQVEKCLRTMSSGDKCYLMISADDDSCLKLKIEMNTFSDEPDLFELSVQVKVELAKIHKQKGVDLFKLGRDLDAFLRFSKVVKLMITVLDLEETNEEVKTLYTTACNNMSWCHLKKGNNAASLALSNKVIAIYPTNVKALMRRADVFHKLDDVESAARDLKHVLKLEPNNNIARERLIVVQHKLDIENEKYASIIKKMFR